MNSNTQSILPGGCIRPTPLPPTGIPNITDCFPVPKPCPWPRPKPTDKPSSPWSGINPPPAMK